MKGETSLMNVPNYMSSMKKWNDVLIKAEKWIMTFCTIMLVAAIFIQVVCRYILLISTPWAEELARYLFVWMSYLGGGYALHTGGQIEIDIIPTLILSLKKVDAKKKERWILYLRSTGLLITVFFLLGFCWVFSHYILFISHGSQTSQTMHIPMWIIYFPILIGSLITVWHGCYRFIGNIYGVSVKEG